MNKRPHVVIVGAGLAGLNCACKLAPHADVRVTLIDNIRYFHFDRSRNRPRETADARTAGCRSARAEAARPDAAVLASRELPLGFLIWAHSSSVWVISTLIGIGLIFSSISRIMLSSVVRSLTPSQHDFPLTSFRTNQEINHGY
jgi:hypothetical protein